MAVSLSFHLVTLLALLSVVKFQDGAQAELTAPRWPGIKPSRMSAYVIKPSPNKLRIPDTLAPTVTRTAIELQTVTIITTSISTIVQTTVINALRETSIFVPVSVTTTATPDTTVVYVRATCTVSTASDPGAFDSNDARPDDGVKQDVVNGNKTDVEGVVLAGERGKEEEKKNATEKVSGEEKPASEKVSLTKEKHEKEEVKDVKKEHPIGIIFDGIKPAPDLLYAPVENDEDSVKDDPITVTDVKPSEETVTSLLSYLSEFHDVVGQLDVPHNRRKMLMNFVKVTSAESLQETTLAQKMAIKEQLKELCEEGLVARDDSGRFFEKVAGFVDFMKNYVRGGQAKRVKLRI